MRRSRFSEEQIVGILKEHEAGAGTVASRRCFRKLSKNCTMGVLDRGRRGSPEGYGTIDCSGLVSRRYG